jgi:hypothetical protein
MQRGLAAAQARNPAEAVQWFEAACKENPNDAQARAWLGQSLCSSGRRADGTALLREAGGLILHAARGLGSINPVLEIAAQLQHWSDFAGALELLSKAARVRPFEFRCHQLLAVTYAQLNKRSEALAAGERALQLQPGNTMMQVLQGSLEADAGKSALAGKRLEKVLAGQPAAREAFRAHKELARIRDKLGEYDQVFAHLNAASSLSGFLPEYAQQDATLIPDMVKANRATFDRTLLGRWSEADFPAGQGAPVFVLGFMRSGTTLTQEVLDAHAGVFVADEVGFISDVKRELDAMDPAGTDTADKLRRLEFSGVLHLREFYWRKVHERFGDSIGERLFVDKLTMNTVDLGLINCIFPDARVVFVMRDPRDVCLSCYMQLMVPTPTTVQLLTWEGAAAFYALVMEWWIYIRQEMTLKYIEFRYEDVVAGFEATYRKVFDFLGLPWDRSVVSFHEHAAQKFIATPSRIQVAQPLYASSVGRWRLFENEFARIDDLLRPYVQAFEYDRPEYNRTPAPNTQLH